MVLLNSCLKSDKQIFSDTGEVMYDEFKQNHFMLDGHEGAVIFPQGAKNNKPYIWRAEFPGAFDSVDRELLRRGWHLVYYRISDLFGCPSAIEKMHNFQTYIEDNFGLSRKAVIFGFSRGGLYAVNYAAAYPGKVAKLYLDAPVLDVFSWPGGLFRGIGSRSDWEICRKLYGIGEGVKNYPQNPINNISVLIKHKIPVILVAGDADEVVPLNENGKLLYADYMLAGAPIKFIIKPGIGHHPHSLDDPKEIADWIEA